MSALPAFRLMFVPVFWPRRILFLVAMPVVLISVLRGSSIAVALSVWLGLSVVVSLFVLIYVFVVLPVLFVGGLPVRFCASVFLRTRLVLLRIHGNRKSQKYSQCGGAKNCS
jgi:hypothetical protein